MARLDKFAENGKVGYKNEKGEVVIQPQFDQGCSHFGKDMRCGKQLEYGSVSIEKKCGIIKEDGSIIIPLEYEEAIPLFDNLFALRKHVDKKSWVAGVVNSKGETIVPFEYKYIRSSGDMIQCFKQANSVYNYHSGDMDSDGIVYYYSSETDEYWFNNEGTRIYIGKGIRSEAGVLITSIDDKYGVVNKDGTVIISNNYDDIFCISEKLFIVRINDEDNWKFGVINENEEEIIPFNYKFIKHFHSSFFACYDKCQCERCLGTFDSIRNYWVNPTRQRYKYSEQKEPSWFNSSGALIHKGDGCVLCDTLLSVEKDGNWGVYNHNLKRIVNFNYDAIEYCNEKILVGKDGNVGILDNDGTVLISPSYKSIECVSISNDTYIKINNSKSYGRYSVEHPFSTVDCGTNLSRITIALGRGWLSYKYTVQVSSANRLNYNNTFILRSESYEELFSIEEGTINNSRFDQISQLTDISYAVRKGNLWGVYRRDVKELVIPCQYDEIIFEGGHVVQLKKDNLWGAKSLVLPSHIFYEALNVDIPTQYLEIKTLTHPFESLFGVLLIEKNYDNEDRKRYAIIDKYAKEVGKIYKFRDISSQFTYYRPDRILCSIKDKFGFIGLDGFITIPFKYDEVYEGKDGLFHIRIGESWGLLSLDKGEIVPVKYLYGVSVDFKDQIVFDAMSGKCGILSENGTERIPAIYDHLQPKEDLIFFGYGGYDYDDYSSFFSNITGATWGCLNSEGRIIVPPKYACLEIRGDYVIAGRDGSMLFRDESTYAGDYSGVYDLYTKSGELLIGGFNTFEFIEEQKLFKFFFGGTWKHTSELIDEWNGIYHNSYHFEEGMGRWIITDLELKSIKLTKDSKEYTFRKGTIINIKIEKTENKVTHYWNCPIDILFKLCPETAGDFLIYSDSNESYAIRLSDGKESVSYDEIEHIYDDIFFVRQKDKVGIANFNGEIILPIDYVALTKPVSSYIFGVTETEEGLCRVDLIDLSNDGIKTYQAIAQKELSDVLDSMAYGLFLIYPNYSITGLKSISVYRRSEFDEGFQCLINENEEGEFLKKHSLRYWFSNHWNLKPHEYSRDYDDVDDTDYARDTWDAMTDGMYGDMPDGFDGDYDFLGR